MLTTGTQNLPEPLARVQAAYHGTARLAPASAGRLARRVEHFASSVQFFLEDSDAARRLHTLTKDLRAIPPGLPPRLTTSARGELCAPCPRRPGTGSFHAPW